MGNSVFRTVARTGDHGQTNLGLGTRVDKDSPPIEVLGVIEELNSWIGVLIELSNSQDVKEVFSLVQHDLFELSAQIRVPGTPLLSRQYLLRIEESLERINADFTSRREFILPGGVLPASLTHVARAVCRRAERRLFSLCELDRAAAGLLNNPDNSPTAANFGLSYLNRLSELLFLASRIENKVGGRSDVLWDSGKSLGRKTT